MSTRTSLGMTPEQYEALGRAAETMDMTILEFILWAAEKVEDGYLPHEYLRESSS